MEFPGGDNQYEPYVFHDKSFKTFKKENQDVHGTVYILAFFDENGKIYDAQFLQRLHPVADEVAMHIILTMPKWLPALDSNGKPTKTDRRLDIKF